MADTVITPSAYDRGDSGAAGWAVAVIVLLGAVLFGLFVWPGMTRTSSGNASTPQTPQNVDVNVRLPQGLQGSGQNSGGTQNQGGTQQTPTPTQ